MALVPIAGQGNYLHIYDFRVDPHHVDEFVRLFNEFDYSDANPMHKSPAQVRDGVLVQDVADPGHFWLVGEWKSVEEHAKIRKIVAEMRPEFAKYISPGGLVPAYGRVISSTPQALLDKASSGET